MKLLRLPHSKIQLGLPLPWNVRDADEQLLLKKGCLVETERQLDALLARGAFVDAEEVRAAAIESAPAQPSVAAAPLNLFGLWEQATQTLKKLVTHTEASPDQADGANFPAQIDEFARHVIQLVDYNSDIAIYRCLRQEQAHLFYYGYAHALHAATLCLMLARHLQWPPEQVLTFVKTALTMNISILNLQGQMAVQDVPMKDSQRQMIGAHPMEAVHFLRKKGVTQTDWLTAVAQHHEHADGTGYPAGVKDISEMAIALRVTDVFVAKISPRVLRAALSSQEAAKQLFREDQGGRLSTALIKVYGIYPPGEFVKLANGESGIVVERTSNLRAPVVATITDSAGRAVLHTVRRDTADARFAIAGLASDKSLLARLPPERLYGYASVSLASKTKA